ncbi:MAG: DNA polymerase III subunit chi [Deltaproteobacteria bacterium]
MGDAFFYHMTDSPLERTLPMILSRSLDRGWRVLVRGGNPGRLDWLDERLWLDPKDSFLPHGKAGGEFDAVQPVLLGPPDTSTDGFACLITLDGTAISPAEITKADRACILFDGNDPAAVEHARTQWRELTGAGVAAKYWSDAGGKWEQKA